MGICFFALGWNIWNGVSVGDDLWHGQCSLRDEMRAALRRYFRRIGRKHGMDQRCKPLEPWTVDTLDALVAS